MKTRYRHSYHWNVLKLAGCLSAMLFVVPARGDEPDAGAPVAAQPPPPPSDNWPGILKMPDREDWTAPGLKPKYATDDHVKLVGIAQQCSDRLASAQWRQDILSQLEADAHFDNCSFDEGIAYINKLQTEIDTLVGKSVAKPSDQQVTAAADLIGRALHGIQDFYSHTNYVELMSAKGESFDEKLVIPIWTQAGTLRVQALVSKNEAGVVGPSGLVSGIVWWNGPKHCAKDVKPHAELAKDSEQMPSGKKPLKTWNMSGYRASYQLADWATRQFLRHVYETWPALRKRCGGSISYLNMVDRRSP